MALSTLPVFSAFAIDVPPYTSAQGVSVPAFNDATVTTAVTTLVNKFPTFAGNPSTDQLAESTARDFAKIVRSLSLLGA